MYYATDRSKSLKHWKYIKRERGKNGKWKYYYDTASLKSDVKNAVGINQYNRMNKAEDEYGSAKGKYLVSKGDYEYNNRLHDKNDRVLKDFKYTKANLEDYIKYTAEYANTGKKYAEAQKEFYKTPLGKLKKASETVAKGLSAVNKFLGKTAKKVKKALNKNDEKRSETTYNKLTKGVMKPMYNAKIRRFNVRKRY